MAEETTRVEAPPEGGAEARSIDLGRAAALAVAALLLGDGPGKVGEGILWGSHGPEARERVLEGIRAARAAGGSAMKLEARLKAMEAEPRAALGRRLDEAFGQLRTLWLFLRDHEARLNVDKVERRTELAYGLDAQQAAQAEDPRGVGIGDHRIQDDDTKELPDRTGAPLEWDPDRKRFGKGFVAFMDEIRVYYKQCVGKEIDSDSGPLGFEGRLFDGEGRLGNPPSIGAVLRFEDFVNKARALVPRHLAGLALESGGVDDGYALDERGMAELEKPWLQLAGALDSLEGYADSPARQGRRLFAAVFGADALDQVNGARFVDPRSNQALNPPAFYKVFRPDGGFTPDSAERLAKALRDWLAANGGKVGKVPGGSAKDVEDAALRFAAAALKSLRDDGPEAADERIAVLRREAGELAGPLKWLAENGGLASAAVALRALGDGWEMPFDSELRGAVSEALFAEKTANNFKRTMIYTSQKLAYAPYLSAAAVFGEEQEQARLALLEKLRSNNLTDAAILDRTDRRDMGAVTLADLHDLAMEINGQALKERLAAAVERGDLSALPAKERFDFENDRYLKRRLLDEVRAGRRPPEPLQALRAKVGGDGNLTGALVASAYGIPPERRWRLRGWPALSGRPEDARMDANLLRASAIDSRQLAEILMREDFERARQTLVEFCAEAENTKPEAVEARLGAARGADGLRRAVEHMRDIGSAKLAPTFVRTMLKFPERDLEIAGLGHVGSVESAARLNPFEMADALVQFARWRNGAWNLEPVRETLSALLRVAKAAGMKESDPAAPLERTARLAELGINEFSDLVIGMRGLDPARLGRAFADEMAPLGADMGRLLEHYGAKTVADLDPADMAQALAWKLGARAGVDIRWMEESARREFEDVVAEAAHAKSRAAVWALVEKSEKDTGERMPRGGLARLARFAEACKRGNVRLWLDMQACRVRHRYGDEELEDFYPDNMAEVFALEARPRSSMVDLAPSINPNDLPLRGSGSTPLGRRIAEVLRHSSRSGLLDSPKMSDLLDECAELALDASGRGGTSDAAWLANKLDNHLTAVARLRVVDEVAKAAGAAAALLPAGAREALDDARGQLGKLGVELADLKEKLAAACSAPVPLFGRMDEAVGSPAWTLAEDAVKAMAAETDSERAKDMAADVAAAAPEDMRRGADKALAGAKALFAVRLEAAAGLADAAGALARAAAADAGLEPDKTAEEVEKLFADFGDGARERALGALRRGLGLAAARDADAKKRQADIAERAAGLAKTLADAAGGDAGRRLLAALGLLAGGGEPPAPEELRPVLSPADAKERTRALGTIARILRLAGVREDAPSHKTLMAGLAKRLAFEPTAPEEDLALANTLGALGRSEDRKAARAAGALRRAMAAGWPAEACAWEARQTAGALGGKGVDEALAKYDADGLAAKTAKEYRTRHWLDAGRMMAVAAAGGADVVGGWIANWLPDRLAAWEPVAREAESRRAEAEGQRKLLLETLGRMDGVADGIVAAGVKAAEANIAHLADRLAAGGMAPEAAEKTAMAAVLYKYVAEKLPEIQKQFEESEIASKESAWEYGRKLMGLSREKDDFAGTPLFDSLMDEKDPDLMLTDGKWAGVGRPAFYYSALTPVWASDVLEWLRTAPGTRAEAERIVRTDPLAAGGDAEAAERLFDNIMAAGFDPKEQMAIVMAPATVGAVQADGLAAAVLALVENRTDPAVNNPAAVGALREDVALRRKGVLANNPLENVSALDRLDSLLAGVQKDGDAASRFPEELAALGALPARRALQALAEAQEPADVGKALDMALAEPGRADRTELKTLAGRRDRILRIFKNVKPKAEMAGANPSVQTDPLMTGGDAEAREPADAGAALAEPGRADKAKLKAQALANSWGLLREDLAKVLQTAAAEERALLADRLPGGGGMVGELADLRAMGQAAKDWQRRRLAEGLGLGDVPEDGRDEYIQTGRQPGQDGKNDLYNLTVRERVAGIGAAYHDDAMEKANHRRALVRWACAFLSADDGQAFGEAKRILEAPAEALKPMVENLEKASALSGKADLIARRLTILLPLLEEAAELANLPGRLDDPPPPAKAPVPSWTGNALMGAGADDGLPESLPEDLREADSGAGRAPFPSLKDMLAKLANTRPGGYKGRGWGWRGGASGTFLDAILGAPARPAGARTRVFLYALPRGDEKELKANLATLRGAVASAFGADARSVGVLEAGVPSAPRALGDGRLARRTGLPAKLLATPVRAIGGALGAKARAALDEQLAEAARLDMSEKWLLEAYGRGDKLDLTVREVRSAIEREAFRNVEADAGPFAPAASAAPADGQQFVLVTVPKTGIRKPSASPPVVHFGRGRAAYPIEPPQTVEKRFKNELEKLRENGLAKVPEGKDGLAKEPENKDGPGKDGQTKESKEEAAAALALEAEKIKKEGSGSPMDKAKEVMGAGQKPGWSPKGRNQGGRDK